MSDLHFGIENTRHIPQAELDKRKTTLDKFIKNLKTILTENKEWKPGVLVISGDIGFAGKKEDYNLAREWLTNLLTEIRLTNEDLILCPGNHDRYIEDIMENPIYPNDINDSDCKWYKWNSESFSKRFEKFIDFAKEVSKPLSFKSEDNYLIGFKEVKGLRFIVLNSSRFVLGGKKDKGNLFLGWPIVNTLEDEGIFVNPDDYDNSKITIAVFHHPDNWYHDEVLNEYRDHVATYNFLTKRCHIMLSGHVHSEKIGPPKRSGYGAWHFSVGATYLRQEYANNFAILKINFDDRLVKRLTINFDSSNLEWKGDFSNIESYSLTKNQEKLIASQIKSSKKRIEKNTDQKKEKKKLEKFNQIAKVVEKNKLRKMYREIKDKKFIDNDPSIIAWQRVDKGELDTSLLYSYPQSEDNIKEKKFFAVKDYEKALFYNKGELVGVLGGGVYELDKKAKIKGTEIVWIDISFIEIPWGIPQTSGIPTKNGYTIGLHGDLKLRISDIKTFYNDVVAGKKEWTVQDLKDWIKSLLHTSLRDIFKRYNVKYIILEDRERVINLVTSKVTEEFLRYGLELETFNIIGVKTPKDAQKLFEQDKEKTEIIVEVSKNKLEKIIQQKNEIQNRIKELKDKLKEQQDLLLNDKISQEDYEKKKNQIQIFIDEAQEELRKIEEKIANN